jgi:broad specificity phosphatase PhoE
MEAQVRRWRGLKDVPLTSKGMVETCRLQHRLGQLDMIYHDRLTRCRDTAVLLKPTVLHQTEGPLPWNMGELFEGREITEESLALARWYIQYDYHAAPRGGESFHDWAMRWYTWISHLNCGYAAVGVVTHNRNIQYLYARQHGWFSYQMYDCIGPDFLSVHYYDPHTGHIAPWGGRSVPRGIYLIRHAETEYGT